MPDSPRHEADPTALVPLAESLFARGDVDRARIVYRVAAEQDATDDARRAYASFLMRIEEFALAVDEWNRLRAAALDAQDTDRQADAELQLAVAHRELGQYHEARLWQQRALAARSSGVSINGDDLSHSAIDAVHAGELSLARDLLSRAFASHVESGSLEDQAADVGNLAAIALLRGELSDGIHLLWFAYRMHTELGDHRGAGIDLLNLAEAHMETGELDAAARLCGAACVEFQRATARRSLERAEQLSVRIESLRTTYSRDHSEN